MATEYETAVEALERELQNLNQRASEVRKTINQLLFLAGSGPRYSESDQEMPGYGGEIKARQFVGRELLEATEEAVLALGGKAYTSTEILNALKEGDFDFSKLDWKPKGMLRNLGIFLGNKKDKFVWFDSKEGKIYGLAAKFPERKRELDRLGKKDGNNSPPEEGQPPS